MTVLRGARLVRYEGAGHAFHWENPAPVAKDLSAFLSTVPQPR